MLQVLSACQAFIPIALSQLLVLKSEAPRSGLLACGQVLRGDFIHSISCREINAAHPRSRLPFDNLHMCYGK